MGVTVEVGGADRSTFEEIRALFAAREAVFSRFRSGSELSRLNRSDAIGRRGHSRLRPRGLGGSRSCAPDPRIGRPEPRSGARGCRLRPELRRAPPGRAPAGAFSPRLVAGGRHRRRDPLSRGGDEARPERRRQEHGGRRRRRLAPRRRLCLGRRRPRRRMARWTSFYRRAERLLSAAAGSRQVAPREGAGSGAGSCNII